jgi:hypothetical protein
MKKRTVKILKIIAIILIVLSLLYAIAVGVSAAKLNRVYADLRKDGRPLNQDDVIPKIVPDAENAALLYESAILLLKAQPAPEGNLLEYLGGLSGKFIKESLDPDKLVELQQLIDQDIVTQALSIVEQGTQRPSCWFDRDYNDGIYTLLPNVPNFREFSRILSAKARIEAQAGNLDKAWNMVRTQLRFADAMLNEPIIVPQLVRIAIIRMACRTIQELCAIEPPNEQQCRNIQELLSGLDDMTPMVRGIDGERLLIGEWAFNLPKNELYKIDTEYEYSENTPGIFYRFLILRITFKPFFLADRAAYMRFMHESVGLFEDSYEHDKANIERMDYLEEKHMLTSILMPATSRIKVLHCEFIAELRITQAGLALLQHKQDGETFPETLESFKKHNINDPFSGQQLLYKSPGQGFILYSIGPDEKDNEGSPKQKKQEKDWDIVWSYTGGS